MKIYYDAAKTKEIEQKLIERYGENKKEWAENGYNVSELSNCEAKCFNRRTGVEQRISKQGIGFLIFGIIAEQVICEVYPVEQRQYEINFFERIYGHMDVYENFMYPLEGKATAKQIFKAIDLPVYWVMQLVNYIAMSKGNRGWLVILGLFTRNLAAFCVELSSEDKLNQIEANMNKIGRLDNAIATKDASALNINPEEYELCHYKHSCSRKSECRDKFKEIKNKKKGRMS